MAALADQGLVRMVGQHQEELRHLGTINSLFVQEQRHAMEQVRSVVSELVAVLRQHMAEQEAGLFPTLERILARRNGGVISSQSEDAARLNETMTVNRVISQYPRTKAVFEECFINLPFERYDCLDEVAWRHGMESEELLDRLERAIAPQATPEAHLPLVAKAHREVVSCTP